MKKLIENLRWFQFIITKYYLLDDFKCLQIKQTLCKQETPCRLANYFGITPTFIFN